MNSSPPAPDAAPSSRLARRLGTSDAVFIGLGAMMGAGVFSAIGPATRIAGNMALVGLLVAGALAYCNAVSTAALAALYPESGGAYVYGRRRLGDVWGFLAGWGFVIGKLASSAAMALTFGRYLAPARARPLAVAAVVALTAVNSLGIRKTTGLTKLIVALVLAALATCFFATIAGGTASLERLWPLHPTGAAGVRAVFSSAGLLFFAFAGYARIATLSEEVVDPARTIPRAIPIALGLTLVVYAAVLTSATAAVDGGVLATAPAPLAAAIQAGRFAALAPAVKVGAAVGSLGVLLSLIAGVSRTIFAMATARDLPAPLAAVHPRHQVPRLAVLLVGAAVLLLASVFDLAQAIGFSSFTVLTYYAVANAAALTLPREARRVPVLVPIGGLVGCVAVAASLPIGTVLTGLGVLALGLIAFGIARAIRRRPSR